MAKSVNKVILIGNLGKDPEVKYTPQGTAVAKFSLATNERFKDKQGEWQDRTEWHNITCWARLAEIAGEYLKKGRTVYIEGSLRTDSWDDKQTGQKKYMTNIVANDLVLLGGGRGEGGGGGGEEGGYAGGRSRGAAAGNDFDQRGHEPAGAKAPRRAPRSPTTIFRSDNVAPYLFCRRGGPYLLLLQMWGRSAATANEPLSLSSCVPTFAKNRRMWATHQRALS